MALLMKSWPIINWAKPSHGKARQEAGTKVPSLSIIFGLSSKTRWLSGATTLISSAFTALLNCAEVGRRNRILTNYRFLSHFLFSHKREVLFLKFDILVTERERD